MLTFSGSTALLLGQASPYIQNDPQIVTKTISAVLGKVINFIYNGIDSFMAHNALGFTIIIFTIIIRLCMIPLAVKQQKSMEEMQILTPEVDKIKKKYSDKGKDPEIQKQMNAEIQALYAKHKVNPLAGCFPVVIQLPILLSLNYIINHAYLFISKIGVLYDTITNGVMIIIKKDQATMNAFHIIANANVPTSIQKQGKIVTDAAGKVISDTTFHLDDFNNLKKIIHKFTDAEWSQFTSTVDSTFVQAHNLVFTQIHNVESFFGINLTANSSLTNLSVIIPILAIITTFLTSYLTMKRTVSTSDSAKTQQKIMLYVMPVMMGYFSIGFSAGVGLYWITSSTFQICQQLVLNKEFDKKRREREAENPGRIIEISDMNILPKKDKKDKKK